MMLRRKRRRRQCGRRPRRAAPGPPRTPLRATTSARRVQAWAEWACVRASAVSGCSKQRCQHNNNITHRGKKRESKQARRVLACSARPPAGPSASVLKASGYGAGARNVSSRRRRAHSHTRRPQHTAQVGRLLAIRDRERNVPAVCARAPPARSTTSGSNRCSTVIAR